MTTPTRKFFLKLVVGLTILGLFGMFDRFVLHQRIRESALRVAARPLNGITNAARTILRTTDMDALQRERDALLAEKIEADVLARENTVLRKQLGVETRDGARLQPAKIIGQQRNVLTSTIVIDKGRAEGLQAQAAVIAGGNILVGTVDEIFEHSATVIVVDDPRSIVSVRIADSDLLAEARGASQNRIYLNLISKTDEVAVESRVVTSGLDAYPEGLILGRLTSVERGEHSLFKAVTGELYFDPTLSPLVFVIL